MKYRPWVVILCLAGLLSACSDKRQATVDAAVLKIDAELQQKYGKTMAELPEVRLVVISPHDTDIAREYESAFADYYALEYGERLTMEWRDVGGGATSILQHLRNVYEQSDRSGIDIVWGGGDYNFGLMAEEGLLKEMTLAPDVIANIPPTFGGLAMIDSQHRWIGSALSGFGLFYNKQLLERINLPMPRRWEDLGSSQYFDLVGLADPMQSGSAAASYEMIVQTGDSWADGWAKLLSILGNAKKFYSGGGDAAEALPTGEVAVTTCIDFYGTNRMAKYPDTLRYDSPKGQTAFNPDPIAILKNPPNPVAAQRLIDFVLSEAGQLLWALPAGHPRGPVRAALGRQPIRKDVYVNYGTEFSPAIVNPYAEGQSMEVDTELWADTFGVLRNLVWAAAVRNQESLRAAKRKLIDTEFEPARLALFNALPDNVASREAVRETDLALRDKIQRDVIVTDWISFFREKYEQVAR
jgi:iron(III) transport system substrate-binding protein